MTEAKAKGKKATYKVMACHLGRGHETKGRLTQGLGTGPRAVAVVSFVFMARSSLLTYKALPRFVFPDFSWWILPALSVMVAPWCRVFHHSTEK